MGQLTQEHRLISISGFSLGTDTFVITSLEGSEYLSDLFEFELEVLSENLNISADSIIGKPATVTVQNDVNRKFNGYVRSMTYGEVGAHNLRSYRLTLVPWLWFLTKTNNCRIFQEMSAKDIVTQVFNELGFNDFEFKASGGSTREYCVQYNESDFNFVSRLLEEEGIAYYFEHTDTKHQMVLVDQANAYQDCAETDLEYSNGSSPNIQVSRWEHLYDFKKGMWTLNDYNFKEPQKNLTATTRTNSTFSNNATYEHYEYPTQYDFGKGKDLVKIRLEAEESLRDCVQGTSDCSSFYAGGRFTLAKHDTASEQGSFILVGVNHHITDTTFFSGEEGHTDYSNDFICVPSDVHFRPSPIHEKPLMKGPQSAVVVGPAGEEIYIDEYGRIKVQFIWDRQGELNENSSCFIRVVQSWAGNQWGSSFIPRIGHEVIVNFLDGDPDRPLVTGSVYNGKNKPVYSSKTQSGIKSRSTKGGTAQNFNELRFDDKKGNEQIYIHAEKNLDTHVENNETLTVENDRTKKVEKNETYDVGENRTKTIGSNQSETIGDNKTTKVGGNHSEVISKNMEIQISKNLTEKVGGSYTETVTKDSKHSASTITFSAEKEIVLKTGSAKIVMKKNGDITISGKNITVKGSGNVVLKGSKVTAN